MPDLDPDMRRKYLQAIANLPWIQREVFKLHAIEKLSYPEIALLLGTNTATVERQIARAIYKIGKQVDGTPLRWWERWL